MGAALGEVNSGVALGGRWDGSMGQQHGTTRRRKLTSGIALCSNLLDPHACPYPALLEEGVAFSAACDAAHCFANPARCLDPPIASDKHGFEVGVPFCVVFCPITSHGQKCCREAVAVYRPLRYNRCACKVAVRGAPGAWALRWAACGFRVLEGRSRGDCALWRRHVLLRLFFARHVLGTECQCASTAVGFRLRRRSLLPRYFLQG